MKDKAYLRINVLRPMLKDHIPSVRIAAAEAIEAIEAASSIDEILLTLKTGNMGAKVGAIYALGEVGGNIVLPPLAYCASRTEEDLRSAAAAALGKVALPDAIPILCKLLEDESPTVQGRAVEALRNFHQLNPDIITKLRSFLDASDGILEAEAALTMAALKDLYSLDQIILLLTSTHASTRQAAATALGNLPLQ